MITWRSLDCAPGEVDCIKNDTSSVLVCNPRMDNQGFIDEYFCERRCPCDKEQHKFMHGDKDNVIRKIGLHEW